MTSLERTPTSKRSMRCNRNINTDGGSVKMKEPLYSSTASPLNNSKLQTDNEDSPVYFPTTQESSDDIAVIWDWNSPRRGEKLNKKKRLLPLHSPKVPIKRHPSNNRIQTFDKLKEELKALQAEFNHVEDESILSLSPQQEDEYKGPLSMDHKALEEFAREELMLNDAEYFFNDSADEDLLLLTQKIEDNLKNENILACDNDDVKKNINNTEKSDISCTLFDDSFDLTLAELTNNNIESLVKKQNAVCNLNAVFDHIERQNLAVLPKKQSPLEIYDSTIKSPTIHRTDFDFGLNPSSKFEFKRTKSFEIDKTHCEAFSKSSLSQIERKRLEALAKLESKCKLEPQISPSRCTTEEIERKRRQARAKLESKKSFQEHSTDTNEKSKSQLLPQIEPKLYQCTAEDIERKRLQAMAKLKTSPMKMILENNRIKDESFTSTSHQINQIKGETLIPSAELNTHKSKSVFSFNDTTKKQNTSESSTNNSSNHLLLDIERKRQEALAKLKSKQQESDKTTNNSSMQLSSKQILEEVERKRREALAKLEAKKMQDIMERNRLEALKRLQQSKMKSIGKKV